MRNLGWWVALAAGACVCACSSSSDQAISGKVTVHTGVQLAASSFVSAHVLLGDGTKFDKPVDANGDVVFEDDSLEGPQTVSIVTVDDTGYTAVMTAAGVNRADLWLLLSLPPGQPLGTLRGNVTGIADAQDSVSVTAISPAEGSADVVAGGAYSVDVSGPDGGTSVTLVASEAPGSGQSPVRVGMVKDVAIGSTTADIALDHPVDQTVTLTVDGMEPFGTKAKGSLAYALGDAPLFQTRASGTSPLSVPAIARTAPFDTTTMELTASAGDPNSLPNGVMQVRQPFTGTSAQVTLPAPISVTAPSRGSPAAPTDVALASFSLAWNAPSPWQEVDFDVNQSNLDWYVISAASAGSFAFFPLPADASATSGFAKGVTPVVTYAIGSSQYGTYDDSFSQTFSLPKLTDMQRNSQAGYINLQ